MADGLKCPTCGCQDFRGSDGRPWNVTRTMPIPNGVRRYRTCRHCGTKVRTRETIEFITTPGATGKNSPGSIERK